MQSRGRELSVLAPNAELMRVLSEATSMPDAARGVARLLAQHFRWDLAALWLFENDSRLLRHAGGWCVELPSLSEFAETSARLTFASGVGVPGAVLETSAPVWVPDVTRSSNFPRARPAARAGLRTAVGVPIVASGATIGVLELLARERREISDEQVEALQDAGRQLAPYVARIRAEERLRASEETRASIVEAALDCIITMDHEGHIVDFNPAAESTFGHARRDVIGRRLAEVIIPPEFRDAHRRAVARYLETREPTILNRRLELPAMRADGSTFEVELTVTRLGRREPPVFAGFVRDIAGRAPAEHPPRPAPR